MSPFFFFQHVLSEEKSHTGIQNAKVSLKKFSLKHPDTQSANSTNAKPVQHREGRLHFICLNLEDFHHDAFAFFTLQYCMSLNSSAFIY